MIKQNLKQIGCQIISEEKNDFRAKCGQSLLINTPFKGWRLYTPFTLITPIQNSFKNLNLPINSARLGKFEISNWNKLMNFKVNHETEILTHPKTLQLENRYRDSIDKIVYDGQFIMKNFEKIDVMDRIESKIYALGEKVSDSIEKDFRSKGENTICASNPNIRKFWLSDSHEQLTWELLTHCYLPATIQKVENILETQLENKQIHDGNIYIRSYFSPEDKEQTFLLNNIWLYNRETETPYAEFAVTKDKILEQSNLIEKIQNLEKNLNESREYEYLKKFNFDNLKL